MRTIWFPAKKYGWGWGPPCCWQGWLVLLLWMAVMIIGSFALLPKHPVAFYIMVAAMSLALITICWLKGEKPQWRWGNK
jgi:hypothetical protein